MWLLFLLVKFLPGQPRKVSRRCPCSDVRFRLPPVASKESTNWHSARSSPKRYQTMQDTKGCSESQPRLPEFRLLASPGLAALPRGLLGQRRHRCGGVLRGAAPWKGERLQRSQGSERNLCRSSLTHPSNLRCHSKVRYGLLLQGHSNDSGGEHPLLGVEHVHLWSRGDYHHLLGFPILDASRALQGVLSVINTRIFCGHFQLHCPSMCVCVCECVVQFVRTRL